MSTNHKESGEFVPRHVFAKMLGISRWKADRIISTGQVTVRQFPGLHPEVLLSDVEALAGRSIRAASKTLAG